MIINDRLNPYNRNVLDYIRSNMLEAGAPHGAYKPPHDILHPPWGKLGNWSQQYEFLQDYFGTRYKNKNIVSTSTSFIYLFLFIGNWSQEYEFLQDYFGTRYKNKNIISIKQKQ